MDQLSCFDILFHYYLFCSGIGCDDVIAYLFVDERSMRIMLFGDFRYYFYAYFIFTVMIPFGLLFWKTDGVIVKVLASVFIILGSYLGRAILFMVGMLTR